MFHTRILSINDIDLYQQFLLQALHNKSNAFIWGIYDNEIVTAPYLKTTLSPQNKNYIVFGLFSNQSLIAVSTMAHFPIHGLAHKAYLENMCVTGINAEERKENAALLINYIFNTCEEKNIEIVIASVASNNITAKVFFSDLDFDVLAVEQHARKYHDKYIDQHWLIYYLDGTML